MPVDLLLASTNPHKLPEVVDAFGPSSVRWLTLNDVAGAAGFDEPVEDQPTFEGNAVLKARHYAAAAGLPCVADDSGLEVDALGGRPGVHSARYSGHTGPRAQRDPANNAKLLHALAGVPVGRRTARFVCTLALVDPTGSDPPLVARGTLDGRILLPEEATNPAHPERGRGTHGFGYDPLLILTGGEHTGRTTAELTPAQKNALSHRGRAARLLRERLVNAGRL